MTSGQFLSFVESGQVRGLTLDQPYASLVASGDKRIETRSWGTQFRGAVLIHAAKPYHNTLHLNGALGFDTREALDGKVEFVCGSRNGVSDGQPILPRGAVVAVARLKHCLKHDGNIIPAPDQAWMLQDFDELALLGTSYSLFLQLTDKEKSFGLYDTGRFAWYLTDVTALANPVPVKGFQRLCQPGAATIAAVAREIERGAASC